MLGGIDRDPIGDNKHPSHIRSRASVQGSALRATLLFCLVPASEEGTDDGSYYDCARELHGA